MLALKEPIGGVVALANLENDYFAKQPIKQDAIELVDLIKIRIQEQPIEEVARGLLANIFSLRFEIIVWFADNDKDFNFFLDKLNEIIAENIQLARFSKLADTISSVLLAYSTIISSAMKEIPNGLEQIAGDIRANKPEYNTLSLLTQHPSPQMQYFKKWIDASLEFEVGLLVADLLLTEQIKLPQKRINELISFLKKTIIRFGAYSIFTEFWKPDVQDDSEWINSMKILAASLELEHKIGIKTTTDGFRRLIDA